MMGGELAGARARHPSARPPFDLGRMQRRVAGDLAAEGHPWPERAAALLACRGGLGLDRRRFAALAGVPEPVLASLEEGEAGDGERTTRRVTGRIEDMDDRAPDAGQAEFAGALRSWVGAACAEWGYPEPGDAWYGALHQRLPAGLRSALGEGLSEGVVQTVDGHRFRLAGLPPGKGPYAWFNRSATRAPAPNWEYFVQAAEYARLHRALVGTGLTLSFEDELMDVTVRDGDRLVWCIEVKEKVSQLHGLLAAIAEHAGGVDVDAPDRHDDPLRKAKYLVRSKPEFFSLVAMGRRLDFSVEHLPGHGFRLVPDLAPYG